MKEQKQVFNSPKIDENHATIMKKMPKIMNHAKTSKNMKNHEIMPSGTPVVGTDGITLIYGEKIILEVPVGLSVQFLPLFLGKEKSVKYSLFLTICVFTTILKYLPVTA